MILLKFISRTQNRSHERNTRLAGENAFTLFEIMISLGLVSLMLLALWSFFGIYQGILNSSETRVAESQLTRTIQDQLTYDVQHAFLPAPQPEGEYGEQVELETLGFDSLDASSKFDSLAESELADDAFFDDEIRAPLGDVVFEIADSRWTSGDVRFFGNAYGLVIERHVVPDQKVNQPGTRRDEHGQDLGYVLDRARDSLDRVVYCFLESDEAKRQGMPAGLLRWEMNAEQLRWVQQHRRVGIYNLLEELRPELFEGLERDPLLEEAQNENAIRQDNNLNPNAPRHLDHQLVKMNKQLDFVPEVARFRLRYYDGRSWSDHWDSNQLKQMPVAIELSFQLEALQDRETGNSVDIRDGVDALEEDLTSDLDSMEALIDPMELDGEIRTAQTMDIEVPNRFLIFVRPPQKYADDDGMDQRGQFEAVEEAIP